MFSIFFKIYSHTQAEVTAFTIYVNTLSIDGGGTGSVTVGVSKFITHEFYDPVTVVYITNKFQSNFTTD